MLESDYFKRDKVTYPTASIFARFSDTYYVDPRGTPYQTVALTYGYNGDLTENLIHDGFGNRLYVTNEQRVACQSYLIDAERNIQSAFNYGSKYSLLSKFSHQIHKALSAAHKVELSAAFEQIKYSFEETMEFSNFFEQFSTALQGAVKGFVHSLAVLFLHTIPITTQNPYASMQKKARISVALKNSVQVNNKFY